MELQSKSWNMAYLLDKQAFELLAAVVDTLFVGGINYPYERVGLLKVVLPVRAECLLASNIP